MNKFSENVYDYPMVLDTVRNRQILIENGITHAAQQFKVGKQIFKMLIICEKEENDLIPPSEDFSISRNSQKDILLSDLFTKVFLIPDKLEKESLKYEVNLGYVQKDSKEIYKDILSKNLKNLVIKVTGDISIPLSDIDISSEERDSILDKVELDDIMEVDLVVNKKYYNKFLHHGKKITTIKIKVPSLKSLQKAVNETYLPIQGKIEKFIKTDAYVGVYDSNSCSVHYLPIIRYIPISVIEKLGYVILNTTSRFSGYEIECMIKNEHYKIDDFIINEKNQSNIFLNGTEVYLINRKLLEKDRNIIISKDNIEGINIGKLIGRHGSRLKVVSENIKEEFGTNVKLIFR